MVIIEYLRTAAKFLLPLCAVLLLLTGAAFAQRAITVNGQWLTPQQIMIADQNVGFILPNGHYWCDPGSGYWGAVGGNAVGRVHPSQCPALPNQAGSGQSNIHRGPGGTTGGDGSCFYYNDPQTGASVMTGNC
jgi:hypothetical protein